MRKLSFTIYIAIFSLLISCEKETNSGKVIKEVVFSGKVHTASGVQPCYWKNNQRTDLPIPTGSGYSYTSGITTQKKDIYTAGGHYSPQPVACYWKNNERITLPYAGEAWAKDIVVINNDVYVTGYYVRPTGPSTGENQPLLWKNGVLVQSSTFPQDDLSMNIVEVNNEPVIIFSHGTWRNNIFTPWGTTTSPFSVWITSGDVFGADFFVLGMKYETGISTGYIWKNNENTTARKIIPTQPSGSYSWFPNVMKIEGSDTVITLSKYYGGNSHYFAWKNGVETALPFEGITIEIIDSDVYIGGYNSSSRKARYTKNGTVIQLPDEGRDAYISGSAVLSYTE